MARRAKDDPDEIANLHDGLAHPFRVSILAVLRTARRAPVNELRRLVEEAYMPLNARNLQFHLHKMQVAGLVEMKREEGREVVYLLQDVEVRRKSLSA